MHAALLLTLGVLFSGNAWAAGRLELKGYDRLVAAGDSVRLEAKLEKVYSWWFHPDQEDEAVEFWLGPSQIGISKTNDDGKAHLAFNVFLAEGDHWIEARHQPKRGPLVRDAFLVRVLHPDTQLAICDIDHTISDASSLEYITREIDDIPTLPGAVEAVNELSQSFQFVYLTARDDTFLLKTRDWLELKGFPRAPVIFWDFMSDEPNNHGRYKSQKIAQIKKRFRNVPVGFGDKDHDAVAYLEHGLRTYIIPSEPVKNYPKGALLFQSWAEILKHLAENPISGRRWL